MDVSNCFQTVFNENYIWSVGMTVLSRSWVLLGEVVEVVGSNLARGEIFTVVDLLSYNKRPNLMHIE